MTVTLRCLVSAGDPASGKGPPVQPEQNDRALVDFDVLAGWMDAQGLPGGPSEHVETLAGGTQNALIRFRRGARDYVARRAPTQLRAGPSDGPPRDAPGPAG